MPVTIYLKKTLRYLSGICIAAIVGCANTRNIKTDQVTDSTTVKNMIESQNFVFIPRYVNAIGVRNKDLSFGFQISVSKDSIISYLPFFGRGYSATISPQMWTMILLLQNLQIQQHLLKKDGTFL